MDCRRWSYWCGLSGCEIRRIWIFRAPRLTKLAVGHPLCTQKEDCIGNPQSVGGNPVLVGSRWVWKVVEEVVGKLGKTGNAQRCNVMFLSFVGIKPTFPALFFLMPEPDRTHPSNMNNQEYARKDITKYCIVSTCSSICFLLHPAPFACWYCHITLAKHLEVKKVEMVKI